MLAQKLLKQLELHKVVKLGCLDNKNKKGKEKKKGFIIVSN
jgi:hypothetical protein